MQQERGLPPDDANTPAVILVAPQMGRNIGSAARAMLNCGLTDLRLVQPRDGWPNQEAWPTASGATVVLERARVFETTAEAVADLQQVFATTARRRDMVKPVLTPRQSAQEMRRLGTQGHRCGWLFGPERTGLDNDDVALATTLLTVPLNPAFSSLNLAQAVLLLGYEWFAAADATPPRELPQGDSEPATLEQLHHFFRFLERDLDEARFLVPVEKRPIMVRNLRNIFHRAELTAAEVQTLHGVVRSLSGRRNRQGRRDASPNHPSEDDGC